VDQSIATRKRHHCRYVDEGRLTNSRGVLSPGSCRSFERSSSPAQSGKCCNRLIMAWAGWMMMLDGHNERHSDILLAC
jgi:hypothetical protein